jgi:hypothetical protein
MPQIVFRPFMGRTMVEDGHGVKLKLHRAAEHRGGRKITRRLWKQCVCQCIALRSRVS